MTVVNVSYGNAPARALRPRAGDAPLVLALSLILAGAVVLHGCWYAAKLVMGARGPG